MYYVYVLENAKDKSFYTGYTENLKQRIEDHQKGKGSRTTRLKKNRRCIYFEGYLQKDAAGREKFLKSGSGRKYLYKQLTNYLSEK